MSEPGGEILDRAAKVRFVLLDVDGVLTDGRLLVFSDGTEGRAFHARDGHGIRMGQRAGLHFGLLSGRESRVVADRASELYITEVHQGVLDKGARYREICSRLGLRTGGLLRRGRRGRTFARRVASPSSADPSEALRRALGGADAGATGWCARWSTCCCTRAASGARSPIGT